VEKGLGLLNNQGRLGFILPSKFFSTDYGEGLRNIITKHGALNEIVDFGHAQVFENATTYTCLLFLTGAPAKSVSYVKITSPVSIIKSSLNVREINQEKLSSAPWMFSTNIETTIIDKINTNSLPLGALPTRIGRGSSSGFDEIFILKRDGDLFISRLGERIEIEKDILRIPIYATDFGRYSFSFQSDGVIIFPYNVTKNGYKLRGESEMLKDFPKTYTYLRNHKRELETRKQFKEWYGFSAPRNLDVHDSAQMLVPLLANKGSYCLLPDDTNKFCLMASGGFSITVNNATNLSPKYVLDLLNSKLLFWRLQSISNIFRAGWITCTKQYVEILPIHLINFSDPADKVRHDKMVSLVEQMLNLNRKHAATKLAHEKTTLERQIAATDRQIDVLVYELYGLTEEEIKIVEGV
jgi:hypothetical protein